MLVYPPLVKQDLVIGLSGPCCLSNADVSAAALESGSGAHHGGRGAIKTVQVCDMESLQ